jgi:hypothetical protein
LTKLTAIDRAVLELPGDSHARPHANCYWLVPGRVLAGEHPGAVLGTSLTATVDALLDAGVREFIDLTEEHEPPPPYADALRERAAARGIAARHHRFAIPDCGVPSDALMRTILDAIHLALETGTPVYVHCFAGVGRTGTVVGCFLRERGLSSTDALAIIAGKWRAMAKCQCHTKSPEWPEQFAFIASWRGLRHSAGRLP